MDTRKKRADSAAFCSISLRFTLSPVRVRPRYVADLFRVEGICCCFRALQECTSERPSIFGTAVILLQAEAAFSTKDFMRAASFYAKTNYILSFEEIALKFVAVGEQDALRTFLLRKLDNLGREDRSQITMISTWATELYLDKINRLLLDDDKQAGVSESLHAL